jgi:hypothetical protein
MPISPLHDVKKQKNRTTLFIILGVVAVLFCITLIKIATQK